MNLYNFTHISGSSFDMSKKLPSYLRPYLLQFGFQRCRFKVYKDSLSSFTYHINDSFGSFRLNNVLFMFDDGILYVYVLCGFIWYRYNVVKRFYFDVTKFLSRLWLHFRIASERYCGTKQLCVYD